MSDHGGARLTGPGGDHGIAGYENLQSIGSGGSSTVYRAVDVRHQRPVAIKVLDVQATNGRRRNAFQREIEAIGRIGHHPNIVTVLASGFTGNHHPYLVLPLFERGTYGDLVDRSGPLPWADAVDIGVKLASAVETVHRAGVVHRDIKPGNVFVGVNQEHPLLADFGISSTVDGEPTRTATMAVTFGYTAPEVLDDERPTPASDIYSLAMTIFRLIQGLHAHHATSAAAVMRKALDVTNRPRLSAGVPPELAALVADGLDRDPGLRPVSALALARRLQQIQHDHGPTVTPVIVADEPAYPSLDANTRPAMSEPPSTSVAPSAARSASPSAAAIESSMVAALAERLTEHRAEVEADRRPGSRPSSGPVKPDRPARTSTDVAAILAAAVVADRSPGTDDRTTDPADGSTRSPSDLPTVVTPRRHRSTLSEPGPTRPARPWWRRQPILVAAGVGVLVTVITGVATLTSVI